MKKKIVGVFKTEEAAINAIEKLKADGFMDSEISVLAKQKDESRKIADLTDANIENSLARGGASGAAAGGILGGIGAVLLELSVLAIPGVGPFLAAGPIAVSLGSIAAGSAIGGTVGALIEFGFNKQEAHEYITFLDRGDILVLVDEKENKNLVYKNFYDNESVIKDRYDL